MTNQICGSSPCNGYNCPDGSCVNYSSLCTPYNGCPVNSLECPSGECESDPNLCLCSSGGSLCFDGSCASGSTSCPEPPSLIKPVQFTQAISLDQASTIIIPSVEDQLIATLNIPAGALTLNKRSNSEVQIQVSPVADSTIRNTTSLSWPPGSDSTTNIYSPVIQFSAPQVQEPLSKPISISFVVNSPSSVSHDQICLGFINSTTVAMY